MLSRSEFDDEIREANSAARPFLTATIDVERAWDAYITDPDRFSRRTQDNPAGSVAAAFVLQDGDWWQDAPGA